DHAATVDDVLSRLRPGDIITDDAGGRAAVVSVAYRKAGSVKVRLVDIDAVMHTLGSADVSDDDLPEVVGTLEMPTPYSPNNRSFQREVASRLRRERPRRRDDRRGPGSDRARAPRRPKTRGAADRASWRLLEQLERAEADIADLENRARHRSATLVHRFDDVLAVLEHWDYVRDWQLTERGERLVRIYHESDLAIAEALALGMFDR